MVCRNNADIESNLDDGLSSYICCIEDQSYMSRYVKICYLLVVLVIHVLPNYVLNMDLKTYKQEYKIHCFISLMIREESIFWCPQGLGL